MNSFREQDVLQKHDSFCQHCHARITGILVKLPGGGRWWRQVNWDANMRLWRLHDCAPAKAA